ncbi:PQQ-binding-like beta-propeller repeat protein [bacterium]|nr:PQQ-binding-like beta-propeller repeat protein [bacterium]
MDSSKIISLEDFIRKENRYPSEEEALIWALQLCDIMEDSAGGFRMLSPKNVYVENGNRWSTAHPPLTDDVSEALFRFGALLHFLLTRNPFRISHYLDGPPAVRERNPQISVRFESIIVKLLQNVRSLRYSSVPEFKEDLNQLQRELKGDWTVHWYGFKANGARTNHVNDASFQPAGKTLKEVWKADIGDVWGSAVVAGEYLFVGSGDGNFYSIDSQTGKIIWKLGLGARIESTACIDCKTAYIGNDFGAFHAINIRNGSMLWKRNLGEYIRSSAYYDDSFVYVGSINPAQKTGFLWCLNRENGSVVWKKGMGPVFSSPVVDRNEIILGSDDEKLYCLSIQGAEKWKLSLSGKIRSTALSIRDFVYIGSFGAVFYKIRRSTGEIVWENRDAGAMYSSPAYGRSFICVGGNSGAVSFYQQATGKKSAEFATGGPVTATPLIVNQFALVGSNDGIFYILDSGGNAICAFDAKAPMNSTACYHNSMIYVGSDNGFRALSF